MNVENKKRQRIFLNGRSLQARLFSFLLCLVLTLTYSGVYTLADNYDTPYFNRDRGTTDMVSAELVTTDMTALGDGSSTNPKWYVVKEAVTINDRITVTGNVHLILADKAVLTAKKGIDVSAGNSLTIYAQRDMVTESTGKIAATTKDSNAGIGGSKDKDGGSIKITGGKVNAESRIGAGIGGGYHGTGGIIEITGGEVIASSSEGGTGIGGVIYHFICF